MSTQNIAAEMLENTKEARLLDPIDAAVAVETAEALIREAEHETEMPARPGRGQSQPEPT